MADRELDYYEDDLRGTYLGKVLENDDPEFLGRCKILVYGKFGNNEEAIPTEDIPWATPYRPLSFGSDSGSGAFSTPKKDSIVKVVFDGGSIHHPKYLALEELNKDVQRILQDSYENSHFLVYDSDEKLRIYYTKKSGLLIDFDTSLINVKPDGSILIDHKGSQSTIELRGGAITINSNLTTSISSPNQIDANSNFVHMNGLITHLGSLPSFSNVNGEPLMILISILATMIDAKFPTSPGAAAQAVSSFTSLILSKTVKTSP